MTRTLGKTSKGGPFELERAAADERTAAGHPERVGGPSPAFGARLEGAGVRFRLWAPDCRAVSLSIEDPDRPQDVPLSQVAEGWWETFLD